MYIYIYIYLYIYMYIYIYAGLQWFVKFEGGKVMPKDAPESGPFLCSAIHSMLGALQCVAVCCSVLQCVTVCCRVLPVLRQTLCARCVAVCHSVLQCVAVCCGVLHCVAEPFLCCTNHSVLGTCVCACMRACVVDVVMT